jgi:hypothetical protein
VAQLTSDLFRNDAKLAAALTSDTAHILQGHVGEHVKKIQCALALVIDDPPAVIDDGERQAGSYGATTAETVLRYQTERSANSEYQLTPDSIVGTLTIRALDDEIARLEAEFGRSVFAMLANLDRLLLTYQLVLPLEIRARVERVKGHALSVVVRGAISGRDVRLGGARRHGYLMMSDFCPGGRPAAVLPPDPLLSAGATMEAFILTLGALMALLAICAVLEQSGKLGERVSAAMEEVIGTAEAAILGNVGLIDRLSARVAICKDGLGNPTPACLDALARFASMKVESVTKRSELRVIIEQLREVLHGSAKEVTWKLLALRAEKIARELADRERELHETVKDFRRNCGDRFVSS